MKKVLYLYKNGSLKRKDNSLVLEGKFGNDYIPIEQLDMIICFSEINFNKKVLSLLNQYMITILFYNYYGNYIGRFSPKEYKDGRVLVNQVNMHEDMENRMYISTELIYASFKNMLALMKYYRKKGKELDVQIEQLIYYCEQVYKTETIDQLLLLEAKTKQIYYSMFDIVLDKELFKFKNRTKNPPQNEVNAMLSYGYALLYGVILSILDRSSLFPQISFIHSLSKNCDSLQYDLADIFKPVLIDRMVLRMIRKKQMNKNHFDIKEDGRCYLNKEGIKIFVNEFNQMMNSTILYEKRYYSYRSILSKEVNKLSEYIKGNENCLHFFVMKW